jgi:error-prone DNA polymerase
LWEVEGLWAGPLFAAVARDEAPAPLPAASAFDDVLVDYQAVGLSLEHNPVGLVRPTLQARGFVCIAELAEQDPGSSVRIAGLVANRQRPGNAGGVMFMTLEDETGMANLVVWPRLFERQRRVIVGERLIEVFGVLQREGASVSVIAKGFRRLDIAPDVQAPSRDFR